jgi:putative endonuclease
MADDFSALLFEAARRAQAVGLRRRRRALRKAARQKARGTGNEAAAGETYYDLAAPGASGSASSGPVTGGSVTGRSVRSGSGSPPLDEKVWTGDGGPVAPRRLSPKQKVGNDYEDRALALLVRAGLRPLARNLRCRRGEIDLALRDGDTLVLVEVRARGNGRFGGAAASVDRAKQARLVHAAGRLLPRLAALHWGGRPPRVRFDVVAYEGDEPLWMRHAFDVPMR